LPPLGSHVRINIGADTMVATVIEHRCPLGVGGREIIRVRYQFTAVPDSVETELPVDEVTLVDARSPAS
jgi:hypothetical protein